MALSDSGLTAALAELKYLPEAKLSAAQTRAHRDGTSLYDALLAGEFLSEDELGKVAAYHYKLPYIPLGDVSIPPRLLTLLPGSVAARYQTVPYELEDGSLHIATAQPEAHDLFGMLAKKAGAENCLVSYATESAVESALRLYKQKLQTVVDDIVGGDRRNPPVTELVNKLFAYASDARASDVHIEPGKDATVVRFRIDGVLHDEAYIRSQLHSQIVTRLKVLARLRTDEHLSAQDGRLTTVVDDSELTARISIVPVVAGEKVVMRLLAKRTRQFSLTDLGMNPSDLDMVQDGFNRPFGMILSTGPTGSGKTTTMYAILKILNTRDRNIATIEDPVEYEVEGINQIQANTKTNLTFSEGLRSLLRQDPDVLFVGEVRDEETAGIAVNAAMTGHLVLSTMHTNDAVTTLPRLVEMGVEPFLAASTINIIVAQRLVRKICERCKASVVLTRTPGGWKGEASQAGLLTTLDLPTITKHFGKKTSVRVYQGMGCGACHNTGYQGRIGVFEVLEVTDQMAQLIGRRADADELTKQAKKDGMTTMLDDGLEKVAGGLTTLSELIRVTGN